MENLYRNNLMILNDINDIDTSKCSLEDIFKGINPGEID